MSKKSWAKAAGVCAIFGFILGFQNCSQSRLNGNALDGTVASGSTSSSASGTSGSTSTSGGSASGNASCTYANPSVVVDTFTAGTGAFSSAITADQFGNVFSGGRYALNNMGHWIIRKSTDAGMTWTTVDDVSNPSVIGVRAMTVDAAGNIYAAGFDSVGNSLDALVRVSRDHGVTWANADLYTSLQGGSLNPTALFVDSSGNVYESLGGDGHATIRKSADQGKTWTTSDDYVYPATGGAASASGLAQDTNGNIYWVGNGNPAPGANNLIIRKSADHGVTWTTIENFVSGTDLVYGMAIIGDAANRLYVAGADQPSGTNNYSGFILRSLDGGQTWTRSDTIASGSPTSFLIDQNGRVNYVATLSSANGSDNSQVIKRSADGGLTWTVADSYALPANFVMFIEGASLAKDLNGNIFDAAGLYGSQPGALSEFYVRKLACQ